MATRYIACLLLRQSRYPFRVLSHIMPRRSNGSLAPNVHGSAGEPRVQSTTMLHALEHIPPAPSIALPHEELTPPSPHLGTPVDDLTPPPPLSDEPVEPLEPVERKPRKKRASKAAARAANGDAFESTGVIEAAEPLEKPKRKRTSKGAEANGEAIAAKQASKKGVKEEPDAENLKATPKRKRPAKVTKTDAASVASEGEASDAAEKPKKKTPKKSRIAKDEPEYDSEGNEIVKKKRKPRVYPKIEYDIPPVERKATTFKGRLGYACLNTVLRSTKPDSIFCSRTCRIASIEEEGMELPKGLAMMNVRDLKVMIEWNEQNNIRFLRMSSEMFPFASHDKYGYTLEFAAAELKEAGDLAKKYGHRLTMHPGQFTQLGSPKEAVIKSSVRELDYQCEIMDRMGLDMDGVMIIHMGGVYGDKPSTLARFKENYTTRLSDRVKERLVLENDEICYNVDDLMPISRELNIPIIFDYHHDWINPSSEPPGVLIPQINEIWDRRGIRVKQHLSEPRPGAETVMEKRAHADRCKALPPDLPDDVDLMIEAKDKEQAVFELYRIYDLKPVIHDNLRPPNPAPGLRTNGRKSATKKKVKETGEVDSDGNSVVLTDVEKEGDGGLGDESMVSNRIVDPAEVPPVETAVETKKRGGKRVVAQPKSMR